VTTFWLIFGAGLGLLWTFRLAQTALGMRRVPDLTNARWESQAGAGWPRVSIIVPARNEEQGIEPAAQSLLALDYPNYEVLAINDRSSDRTGEILDRVAAAADGRLRVIRLTSLPSEWLGKTHAMHIGAGQATGEWLLFTDADVVFRPDTLRRAINFSLATAADHCVLVPTMLLKNWGERMVGGFFQCMFVLYWGHSPWRVANPGSRDYMGVGAFNLLRREAFNGIGGMERLRMEVVEDLKLGKLVKQHGFQQRAAFGRDLVTLHWAHGALGMAVTW
jgi:cellulose synthase/poly-beta-1,6-N-acetylglucosamine synthase-like glycosyltransferase